MNKNHRESPFSVETAARLLMAAVLVGGVLAWRPGYRSWGLLMAGLMGVLVLWVMANLIARRRNFPGNPMYFILLGPAVVLGWHFFRTGMARPAGWFPLHGDLDLSMLTHLAFVPVGMILAGSLFAPSSSRFRVVLLRIMAAAMMFAPALACWFAPVGCGQWAMLMLGCCGVCIWLSPLGPQSRGRGVLFRVIIAAVAVAPAVAALQPSPAVGWLGGQISLFGEGEQAFGKISAGDSGLAVLLATVGGGGAVWVLGGFLACMAWLGISTRRGEKADRPRGICWLAAGGFALAAMLMPGGFFLPPVMLAMGLTWGLAPAMSARRDGHWPGALLMVGFLVALLALSLAGRPGLVVWIGQAFGTDDKALHGQVGFISAVLLGWLLGARRAWLGAVGIAGAILLGGIVETLQGVSAAGRDAALADWGAHIWGVLIAMGLYLLCIAFRWGRQKRVNYPSGTWRRRDQFTPAAHVLKVVSRWVLAGLGAGMVVFYIVMLVWVVRGLGGGTVVFCDAVTKPGIKRVSVRGCADMDCAARVVTLLSSIPPDGDVRRVWMSRSRVTACVRKPPAGATTLRVVGIPYGPFAFRVSRPVLLGVEPGETVYAVDAPAAVRWSRTHRRALRECIAELQRRGSVLFVHPGPAGPYAEARRILRTVRADIPVVTADCRPGKSSKDSMLRVLQNVRKLAARGGGGGLVLLSDDEALARRVLRNRRISARVHLIVSPAAASAGKKIKGVKFHADLDTFRGEILSD